MQFKIAIGHLLIVSTLLINTGCNTQTVNENETNITNNKPLEQNNNTHNFPITFTDSLGEEITLHEAPNHIVSLAPNTTEILYFLGVEDKIVGRTSYCNYPESITSVTEVGDAFMPNVEAIITLNPDLVVASTHTSPDTMAKLREIGIPVAFINEQDNFEGTYNTIRQIGMLVGKTTEADMIVSEMQTSIDLLLTKVEEISAGKELPRVYYMLGYGDGDYTAGGNTFIGEMLTLVGADNIANEIEGWRITREVIAEKNPEIIIVPSNLGIVEALPNEAFYKDLEAVKEGQVFEIDEDMISRQGPRLSEALDDLAEIIYPELVQ